jgi:hypothetical protein
VDVAWVLVPKNKSKRNDSTILHGYLIRKKKRKINCMGIKRNKQRSTSNATALVIQGPMHKHPNIPMPGHYSFNFQCKSIQIFQCHGIIHSISNAKAFKYSNATALFIQFPMHKHSNSPMPQHYFNFQSKSMQIFQCHGIIHSISNAKHFAKHQGFQNEQRLDKHKQSINQPERRNSCEKITRNSLQPKESLYQTILPFPISTSHIFGSNLWQ